MIRVLTLLGMLNACAWTQSAPIREMSAAAIIDDRMPTFYNGYLYSDGTEVLDRRPAERRLSAEIVVSRRPGTGAKPLASTSDYGYG